MAVKLPPVEGLVEVSVSGGNGGLLLVGQPAGGVDDKATAFQRMVADRYFDLFRKDRADEGARELGDVDFLMLRHQGVAGEGVVVFPACQGADTADLGCLRP